MKKKRRMWVVYSLLITICIILAACTDETIKDYFKDEQQSENFTFLESTKASEDDQQDQIDYKLIEQSEKNYIIFDNMQIYQNDGLSQLATLEFENLAALKNAVTNGKLAEWQKKVVATAFEKNDIGVLTCDFNKLWEPFVPDGCMIDGVSWAGESYSFFVATTSEVFGFIHSYTSEQYQEIFQNDFENFFNNTLINVTEKIEIDSNKVATKYSTASGNLMQIRYNKSFDDKTIVVDETYRLQMNNDSIATSGTVPSNITLYCVENEAYYVIDLFGFTEYPSEEWLSGFGMKVFIND